MSDDQSRDDAPLKIEDVPEPNYEKEMGEDAKAMAEGLAEMLSQATGQPVLVKLHRLDGSSAAAQSKSPHPTLESLREQARHVMDSFVPSVTSLKKDRKKGREQGGVRAVICALSRGDFGPLREFVTRREGQSDMLKLTDEEVLAMVACTYQDNGSAGVGFGMYAGALMTRHGLSLEEVIACACDPVFRAQVLGAKVTPATVAQHVSETLADIAADERTRGLKLVDLD